MNLLRIVSYGSCPEKIVNAEQGLAATATVDDMIYMIHVGLDIDKLT